MIEIKILAVGDIIGRPGVQKLKEILPELILEKDIDFVIANGENAADGMGITKRNYKDILYSKVNAITMGNHTWGKKEIFEFIDEEPMIRPANFPKSNPGKGYRIYTCKGKKIAVINLIGRVSMQNLTENPFLEARKILNEIKDKVDIIAVDFHGEATAEKVAMGYFLDGEATIVFGTHTHIQTADEQILDKGTAYITDIGMTGPKRSVIGMEIETSLKRFETSIPERYKTAEGEGIFNSCLFEIDEHTNKAIKVERINI